MTTGEVGVRKRDTRQQRGWYFYDWANSSFPTTVITLFFGPYLILVAQTAIERTLLTAADTLGAVLPVWGEQPFREWLTEATAALAGAATAAGTSVEQLVDAATLAGRVELLGLSFFPEQLFLYAIPVSAIIQIVTLPILGAFVDRSSRKRAWLAWTAYLGAGTTVAMFLIVPGRWQLAVGLVILANILFQASVVVYDSFLPEIATADDRDRVSSRGWALGYIGGGLLLAINLVIFQFEPFGISGTLAVRISLASAGIWWAVFTIIPLRLLEDGPPLAVEGSATQAVRGAFGELIRTTKLVASYPETVKFLIAFLLFNGGVGTVITAAGSYAIEELRIGEADLVLAILMVQFVAFFGALVMGRIAERAGCEDRRALEPRPVERRRHLRALRPGRRRHVFFALAAAIGFVLGGTQALSRSLFSHLVPARREAEFYSFYQISDRGTNILGPAALAFAYGLFGSYREGILVLIIFFIARRAHARPDRHAQGHRRGRQPAAEGPVSGPPTPAQPRRGPRPCGSRAARARS
jgi:MFS transporter, UMF1 family